METNKKYNKEEANLIKELSKQYEYSSSNIYKILSILKEYPFVIDEEKDKLYECLEEIVADRSFGGKKFKESVEEMVFRIYEDKSINFLSDEFKRRNLELFSEHIDFDASLDELEYDGWITLRR